MQKKKILTFVMATLLVSVFCLVASASVTAEAKASNWASAYLKIVKKMNKEDKAHKTAYYYTPYTYDLIYFDNDSIPELVVGVNGYWVSMYSYDKSKKKVYTVMDQWGYGAGGNAGYSYLPKKNVLYNVNADYAGAVRYIYYGKMKNYQIVSRYAKALRVDYYKDKNHNGMPDAGEYTDKPTYFYGNKKISKKKFKSYTISGNYKPISGSMSFAGIKKKLTAKAK